MIFWEYVPKQAIVNYRGSKLGFFSDYATEKKMRTFIRRKSVIVAREQNLELEDLSWLKGKFLVSDDGFVTKILGTYKRRSASSEVFYLRTAFSVHLLRAQVNCILRFAFHPRESKDALDAKKMGFFLHFFMFGDMINAFKTTYPDVSRNFDTHAEMWVYIFKYIVNASTIKLMKEYMMEDKELQVILKNAGATPENAIKAIVDIMEDKDAMAKDRREAAHDVLKLNAIDIDEKKEKSNRVYVFGQEVTATSIPSMPTPIQIESK